MLNRIVAKMKTVSGSTGAWHTVNTSSYFMSVQISVLCILNFYFVCVCVCYGMGVEARGQHVRATPLLPPCWS